MHAMIRSEESRSNVPTSARFEGDWSNERKPREVLRPAESRNGDRVLEEGPKFRVADVEIQDRLDLELATCDSPQPLVVWFQSSTLEFPSMGRLEVRALAAETVLEGKPGFSRRHPSTSAGADHAHQAGNRRHWQDRLGPAEDQRVSKGRRIAGEPYMQGIHDQGMISAMWFAASTGVQMNKLPRNWGSEDSRLSPVPVHGLSSLPDWSASFTFS